MLSCDSVFVNGAASSLVPVISVMFSIKKSFHLNSLALGCHPETQKLKPHFSSKVQREWAYFVCLYEHLGVQQT